jgi:predicted AlkP superfamily pyrophosphatase or phosphodiesterase
MRVPTVFVYLDGWRHDYVSSRWTPWLHELSRESVWKRVRPTAGFTQRTPMLTGVYPETSGHFTWYRYDPENSPFRWIRPFGFLGGAASYNRLAKVAIRMATKALTQTVRPDPTFIPLSQLPYFDLSINKRPLKEELSHLVNLLSICDENGLRYLNALNTFRMIGSKRYAGLLGQVRGSIVAGDPYDAYLLHLGELDGLGHKYGPDMVFLGDTLRLIDQELERLCQTVRERYGGYKVLLVSDHGMRRVTGVLDLWRDLEQLEYRAPKDYLFFLDSALARFWFRSIRARREVLTLLNQTGNGHVLSEEEMKRHRIAFTDNSYGEVLFWLEKGFLVCPSFFQKEQVHTLGMHGYLNDEEMLGLLVARSSTESLEGDEREIVDLVDVFPTLLDLLGLSIPGQCEGRSVLVRN